MSLAPPTHYSFSSLPQDLNFLGHNVTRWRFNYFVKLLVSITLVEYHHCIAQWLKWLKLVTEFESTRIFYAACSFS